MGISDKIRNFFSNREVDNIDSRLDEINHRLTKLITITKETRDLTMATQAQIDEITGVLTTVVDKVVKIGNDLADYIADNPTLNVDELRTKVEEVAAKLQAMDDSLPEATSNN